MQREIPTHLTSTVKLLSAGFPAGLPAKERCPLIVVMRETGMSDRSVALALSYFLDEPYEVLLHEVATSRADDAQAELRETIRERLRPHGYDEWAKED